MRLMTWNLQKRKDAFQELVNVIQALPPEPWVLVCTEFPDRRVLDFPCATSKDLPHTDASLNQVIRQNVHGKTWPQLVTFVKNQPGPKGVSHTVILSSGAGKGRAWQGERACGRAVKLADDEVIYVFGYHGRSKLGNNDPDGPKTTEPIRLLVEQTNKTKADQMVVLGDFNFSPWDPKILKGHLLANPRLRSRSRGWINLTWTAVPQPQGHATFPESDDWLDQIIVTPALARRFQSITVVDKSQFSDHNLISATFK